MMRKIASWSPECKTIERLNQEEKMKRFLVVLLSLGLVMAFSASAFAVGVDFTGQYYARGSYMNNPTMKPQSEGVGTDQRGSVAYYDQRLRLFPKLKIADGLTLTMRFDAMEAMWGKDQSPGAAPGVDTTSASTARKYFSGNISWERVYVDFATAVGNWRVGYSGATQYSWGTDWMNASGTSSNISWSQKFGDVTVLANLNKKTAGDVSATGIYGKDCETGACKNLLASDVDNDFYNLGATYKGKQVEAGLLWTYYRQAYNRTQTEDTTDISKLKGLYTMHNFQPYAKTKLGPVDLEAEGYWMTGKFAPESVGSAVPKDVDLTGMGVYVNGKFNMGPAYVGAIFVYCSGDDYTTTDKVEGGVLSLMSHNSDTEPWGKISTILFSEDYHDYTLSQGYSNAIGPTMDNVYIYELYGGFAPTKALSFDARLAYMKQAQEVAPGVDKSLGTELDVRAVYKIYDNLTYNIGAAYLWTGDYFKGGVTSNKIENIYHIAHWINLTF
jgi:hypothetical protein